MGRGIAQVAAEAGVTVLVADARRESVSEAITFCSDMIRRKVAKGSLSEEDARKAVANLRPTDAGPERGYEPFADCHVVIEAVAERMDIKHAVRDGLESVVSPACVIATNTSSLAVTGFAAGARHPARFAGFHFFNPVPLMKIVEVIGGVLTDPAVLDALCGLAKRMGHHAVRCTDTPGFLVNHAGRAFGTEALRIVQEGITDIATIDRIMVGSAGFRMGPFELLDLTGLDVSHAVMESIYHQYYEEPRFRPVPITAQRHAAGLFGRKAGRGFYTYREGKIERPSAPPVPVVSAIPSVWVSADEPEAGAMLRALLHRLDAEVETGPRPSSSALILTTPFGADCTTAALKEGLDPTRTVAIDCLYGLDSHRTIMRCPVTAPDIVQAAHALLARDGTPVEVIGDSPGFVAQRIAACIVNVGAEIAQQRVANPDDINRAVELGLGYPLGPLKLGDTLGPKRVMNILDAMHAFYGDPRYRASPWLKRRARLGVSLSTPDG
jgi:3-hydroxybutyryl-CoA dehydrogenase